MKHYLLSLLIFAFAVSSKANNISVSNVTLTGQNVTAGANNAANFTLVQFNLSWDNSLRTSFGPGNWDAAWVFVKFRVNGGFWQHARINSTGNTVPAGSTIDIGLQTPGTAFNASTNPGMGVFIYRNTTGSGTFTATNVQLRWNYGSQTIADNSAVEVQVYGIEMEYVPLGAFNAGGGGGTNAFTSTTINTAVSNTIPGGTGTLGGQAGGYPTGQTAPALSTWPNGYKAFYCMKYEISQQQYTDFLNNLSSAQVTARFLNSNGLYRNGITLTNGVYTTTNPNVSCNFLSWTDLASYLDWSSLRPMTELEYEKASRGNLPAVSNEFAWGNATITGATTITNSGLANEGVNAGANASFGSVAGVQGPLRVGIYAGAATTRAQAGASYYGVMEMSGGVAERVISITNLQGRSFSGAHGDGSVSATGDGNTATWPDATATGTGYRGGSWANSATSFLRISDRNDAATTSNLRSNFLGGRGIRTAP